MLIAISILIAAGLLGWINSIPDYGTSYYYGTRRGLTARADVHNRRGN